MEDDDEDNARPTEAMVPLEKADSTRPTVAMPPLFSDVEPPSSRFDPDFPGNIVAGYLIDGEVGRGGMGTVYAATHPLIGKRVAIKVLSRELGSDPMVLERFLREARAVNAIGHANIVDIFDFGALPDGRQFLVMDLLVGETLRTRLRRGQLPLPEAVVIIDEIASALVAAHGKSIIHRDLKPDNVFVAVAPDRPAEIKLLDFGLAKIASSSPTPPTDGMDRTRAGAIVGTPGYMSPEQARAQSGLDQRTDIYALGVMAFEMIAGRLPYVRASALDTMIAHVEEPVPSLAELVPEVPAALAQLVEAMMAKPADERPTLVAVRAVLKRMPRGEVSTYAEVSLPRPLLPTSQQTISDRPGAKSSRPSTPIARITPAKGAPTNSIATPDLDLPRVPKRQSEPIEKLIEKAGRQRHRSEPRMPALELRRPGSDVEVADPLPLDPPAPVRHTAPGYGVEEARPVDPWAGFGLASDRDLPSASSEPAPRAASEPAMPAPVMATPPARERTHVVHAPSRLWLVIAVALIVAVGAGLAITFYT